MKKECSKAMGNALESILALSMKEWPEDIKKYFDRMFDDLRGLINEIGDLEEINSDMYEALKSSLEISDLWTFSCEEEAEHSPEAKALWAMKRKFEAILAKARGEQ